MDEFCWIDPDFEMPKQSEHWDDTSVTVNVVFVKTNNLRPKIQYYGVGYTDWNGDRTVWDITAPFLLESDEVKVLAWSYIPEFNRV